jgi:hypothetical protein
MFSLCGPSAWITRRQAAEDIERSLQNVTVKMRDHDQVGCFGE